MDKIEIKSQIEPKQIKTFEKMKLSATTFLVRLSVTPLKSVFFNKSYRLNERSSNTRQRWFRKTKLHFNLTMRDVSDISASALFIISNRETWEIRVSGGVRVTVKLESVVELGLQ